MLDVVAVNHYERLKVTQDAPPEVIRAAYRALAQALEGQADGVADGGVLAGDADHGFVQPGAHRRVGVEDRLPCRIVLLLRVEREADGGRVRSRNAADDGRHAFAPYLLPRPNGRLAGAQASCVRQMSMASCSTQPAFG